MRKILCFLFGFCLVALLLPRICFSFEVDLAWSPSPSGDVKGYTVHYGTNSGFPKVSKQDAGDALIETVVGLTLGTTHYFLVTAYDWEGRMSGPSNEVRTNGVVTPDTGEDPVAPGGCFVKAIRLEAGE